MKRWFGEDFDKDGVTAAEGSVSEQLLRRLMEDDEYIRRPPPKSTGREVGIAMYVQHVSMTSFLHKCDVHYFI